MVIPQPLPKEGFAVPLDASFLVFKPLPLLGVAHNNAAPRLTLFESELEFRVLTLTRRSYVDIESVDARQWLGTQNVILGWRARLLAFSGNLGAEDRLVALLTFFDEKTGKLTARAREILNQSRRK